MWYAGAYTAQLDMVPTGVASCFNVPVIFDGAKRDRAIWSGDLLISDPVAQLSLGSNAAPYGWVSASVDLPPRPTEDSLAWVSDEIRGQGPQSWMAEQRARWRTLPWGPCSGGYRAGVVAAIAGTD
ncbi:hypothetical protein [Micromonospora parathelypteridis]|uniref:Uncharacterized protein n=1 Tax=Micromonospora parathelypteridis TaxID=1839617 RepID=A0A840VTX6_9ACTN|nr:hypothetical protein [Micromonospora parathelypteridis]MBB5480652.1 hypothetical protein [Micromonospora parathelypteridis]GGO22346.1 hypothetical protein GCM10011576_41560 [Micromonospora parathelypteridis]